MERWLFVSFTGQNAYRGEVTGTAEIDCPSPVRRQDDIEALQDALCKRFGLTACKIMYWRRFEEE